MFFRQLRQSPYSTLIFAALIGLISISSVQRIDAATLDPAFGTGGRMTSSISNQAIFGTPQTYIQPSGRIVIITNLYGTGGIFQQRTIAAVGLTADGALDPTF